MHELRKQMKIGIQITPIESQSLGGSVSRMKQPRARSFVNRCDIKATTNGPWIAKRLGNINIRTTEVLV